MPVFLCGFVCLLHLLKRRIASPAHVLVRFRLFRPPLSCRAIHPTKNFHAGWLATGLVLFPNNSSSATKKSVNINFKVYVIFIYWVCWVVFMLLIFGTKYPSGWTSGVVLDTVWFPKFPRFSWASAPKISVAFIGIISRGHIWSPKIHFFKLIWFSFPNLKRSHRTDLPVFLMKEPELTMDALPRPTNTFTSV